MAYRPKARKRIRANIPRAPDGSAFQKCRICGLSVAIALMDLHDCESNENKGVKRFRGIDNSWVLQYCTILEPPRSAFRFFMEEFTKSCKDGDCIEVDRKGFENWKNMSDEERQPYVGRANFVNWAFHEALLKDAEDMLEVDDEADSATVIKFDPIKSQFYEGYEDYEIPQSFSDGPQLNLCLFYETALLFIWATEPKLNSMQFSLPAFFSWIFCLSTLIVMLFIIFISLLIFKLYLMEQAYGIIVGTRTENGFSFLGLPQLVGSHFCFAGSDITSVTMGVIL